MKIEINKLTLEKIDEKHLEDVAKKVLKGEKKDLELSIVLACSRRMAGINKKYRKIDKATDVLSFDYGDNIAEIVLCPAVIKKNAQKLNLGYNKELERVLIHGILHVLGYDHEKSKKEAEIMEKKTEKYISK